MKKILVLITLLCLCVPAHAQTYTIERVIDGDTIVVTTPEGKSEKVRLIGIDTPESKPNDKAKRDSERTGQDLETITKMGQEATNFLMNDIFPIKGSERGSLEGAEVKIEYDVQQRDKYGRLLAYIFIDSGYGFGDGSIIGFREHHHIMDDRSKGYIIFLNASIIKAGYATPMTIPPNVKYTDLFEELYEEAREQRRGLWANNVVRVLTEDEAANSAIEFLKENNRDWGEPIKVLRTVGVTPQGNYWYRVNFNERGNKFILVNPETGQAEFSKPR